MDARARRAADDRVARRALRSGLPAGVVARRHAHRVLGVAQGRLPRHPRSSSSRPGKVEEVTHDRAIDMSPAWSRRRQATLLRQRPHRHLEHLRVRHRATHATWQVTNVLGGAFQAAAVARRQAARVRGRGAGGRLRPVRAAARSRERGCRRATTSTTSRRRSTITRRRGVRSARRARIARSSRSRRRRGRCSSTLASRTASIQTGGSDAVGLHGYSLALGLDLDQRRHQRRRVVRLRRLAARACGFAARARSLERGGWRIDGVNKRYREEDWSGTVVGRHPVRVAAERELDAVVRLRRRLVPARRGADDDRSIRTCACRCIRRPTTSRPASARGSRSRRVRGDDVRRSARSSGFDASVSAPPRSSGARRDVPQLHAVSYAADRVPAAVGQDAGARRCGWSARCAPATSCAPAASALGGVPAQDVAMSIVNSTRAGVDRLPARLPGAHGRRQPVPPAQPRVPPGAVADRARPRDAADLPPPRPLRAAVATSAPRSTARSTPSRPARVGRRGAPRSTRSSATSCRARSRSGTARGLTEGGSRRDLVPADGELVKPTSRDPALRPATSPSRSRASSPSRCARCAIGSGSSSITSSATSRRRPGRRRIRGARCRRCARTSRPRTSRRPSSRAGSTSSIARSHDEPPGWFDLAAAVDLGLRLAGHHLGPGIELLFDLGNVAPARGTPGTLALARRAARRGRARARRARSPGSSLSVRVVDRRRWGSSRSPTTAAADARDELGELARAIVTPWGATVDAASAGRAGLRVRAAPRDELSSCCRYVGLPTGGVAAPRLVVGDALRQQRRDPRRRRRAPRRRPRAGPSRPAAGARRSAAGSRRAARTRGPR